LFLGFVQIYCDGTGRIIEFCGIKSSSSFWRCYLVFLAFYFSVYYSGHADDDVNRRLHLKQRRPPSGRGPTSGEIMQMMMALWLARIPLVLLIVPHGLLHKHLLHLVDVVSWWPWYLKHDGHWDECERLACDVSHKRSCTLVCLGIKRIPL